MFFSCTGDMLASRCIMVNDRDVTVYTGPSDMVRNFNLQKPVLTYVLIFQILGEKTKNFNSQITI